MTPASGERKKRVKRWLTFPGVLLALLIAAAIAIPNVLTSCCGSNESSATSTLRSLNTAMVTYSSTYERGFPDSLGKLGPPLAGQPDANNADLVDPVMAGRGPGGTSNSFTRNGYKFVFTPGPGPRITTYVIHADPLERGVSGQRSFYTDETAVIRANATAPATASDQPS